MNRHVFGYDGSPLTDVSVEIDGARLKMKGKMHKGIVVPFSTTTSISTTPEGAMRLHVESMKALGIPAKGLLDAFGLTLDDVVSVKNRRGVDIQDNDIVIAAGQVLPPPADRRPLDPCVVRAVASSRRSAIRATAGQPGQAVARGSQLRLLRRRHDHVRQTDDA